MNLGLKEGGFTAERLATLSEIERWHYWFTVRRMLLLRLADKYVADGDHLVLDVGCGSGLMLKVLAQQGYRAVGIDLQSEGLFATKRMAAGSSLAQAQATFLPFTDKAFRAVTLLDVIEHTDDEAVLEEVHRVLRPGGHAVITVPAMPWLWSYRDEAAGHLRRYTRKQFVEVLARAQLQLREVRYFQCLLFPVVAISRLLGRASPLTRDLEDRPPRMLNACMALISKAEVRLGDVIPWPWGSSLIAVCQKI